MGVLSGVGHGLKTVYFYLTYGLFTLPSDTIDNFVLRLKSLGERGYL